MKIKSLQEKTFETGDGRIVTYEATKDEMLEDMGFQKVHDGYLADRDGTKSEDVEITDPMLANWHRNYSEQYHMNYV